MLQRPPGFWLECGPKTLWYYGLMVLWSYGLMVLRSYGLMVLWSYGRMVLWSYGLMVVWYIEYVIGLPLAQPGQGDTSSL